VKKNSPEQVIAPAIEYNGATPLPPSIFSLFSVDTSGAEAHWKLACVSVYLSSQV
jgi:hypothetical protein